MSTVSVPNTFVNGNANDGPQVSANFSALVSYINTNAIVADGAVSFTGSVSQPNAPTTGNHLTNKTYVDGLVGRQSGSSNAASFTSTVFDTYETAVNIDITNPAKAVNVLAIGSVSGKQGTATATEYRALMRVSLDNGSSWTTGKPVYGYTAAAAYAPLSPFVLASGTATGTIKVQIQVYNANNGAAKIVWFDPQVAYDMFKTVTV